MKSVRFSVFSDLHYRDGNWNQASERLDSIQKRAAENKVDFVIHCGDFCHNVVTGKEIIDRYNHFSIPSYHTIGNHDSLMKHKQYYYQLIQSQYPSNETLPSAS